MAKVGNSITKGVAHDDPTFVSMQVQGNVGFYNTTPIAQPSITAVATATATTTLNETKIDRLYTALRSLGLINTGG